MFKDSWEKSVRLLTEAVDDITTIDDFLAVSGKEVIQIRVDHPHCLPLVFCIDLSNVFLFTRHREPHSRGC